MNQGDTWSIQEYDFLYRYYCYNGPQFVAEGLDRTPQAVSNKAQKMDLLCGEFTREELETIKKYGSTLKGALIFLMPNRSRYDFEEMVRCLR